MINTICICGAGTMGAGIAQTVAQHGFKTILFDLSNEVITRARNSISENLQKLADKGKITTSQSTEIFNNIKFVTDISDCKAELVIEAIVEQLDVKINIFTSLADLNSSDTILASNTSSLSITAIQKNIPHPGRIAGIHFFNPAPLMKLVEVIRGDQTEEPVIDKVKEFCALINKTPVVCKDAPGFIVNRVARHYYLQAMKLVEQKVADIQTVDAVMEAMGFKLGPFKLMDLIGMDINLSVTRQLYEASGNSERFKPANLQVELVSAGKLGRKTGEGFYKYTK